MGTWEADHNGESHPVGWWELLKTPSNGPTFHPCEANLTLQFTSSHQVAHWSYNQECHGPIWAKRNGSVEQHHVPCSCLETSRNYTGVALGTDGWHDDALGFQHRKSTSKKITLQLYWSGNAWARPSENWLVTWPNCHIKRKNRERLS